MEILTEDQQMLLDAASGHLSKNLPVTAFRALRDASSDTGYDAAAFKDIAEMGWMGLVLPEQAGGSDFGYRAAGLIAEQMGRNLTSMPFLSTAILCATLIREIGGDCLSEWGEKIALGECVMALAIDAGHKHNPTQSNVEAVYDGSSYILNGTKSFVINAATANKFILTTRLDNELALFIVDAKDATITAQMQTLIDHHIYANLTITDLKLNADALIAEGDVAQQALDKALCAGRTVIAAEQLGIARECAARTIEYLGTRKQFGVTIGVFQTLQHRMAHLYCEIELTASLVATALQAVDDGAENVEKLTRAAKIKAAKTGRLATEEAVQMHGGIGMTDEMDFGLFMKRNRVLAELLGDVACHTEWLLKDKNI